MNHHSFLKFAVVSAVALAAVQTGSAQNVWLPEPGAVVVTPSHTFQTYDTFFVGKTEMTLPDDITQRTASLRFDYGLAPRLALDVTVGYTQVKFSPPGANFKRSGRDDSQLGLTYAISEETAEVPAFTFRLGAIIEGGYDVPTTLPPINPGDGASGFEVSIAAGKSLAEGFAVYGELGYRNRNHGVPDDIFGSAGVVKQIGPFAVNAGYRRTQARTGGDIGGPGFGTSFGFPGVKEITQFAEGGLSFTDGGGRSYRFGIARKVGTVRNTGEATVYGFSVSLPLRF